ncbi:ArnT family glycosyltransferase [Maribacter sp. 2307ULW6-5]|uniref:ArnT family glycosyltransferase n=1 Tax=Maribacter sp. 2307ULW6-5 TaxID=3386275 RepID=UPI0039BCDCF8
MSPRFAPVHKPKLLALGCLLAITGITFFKRALELEDAEQAYYSQWLRWGYDDQPPLYTWLQYAVNALLGTGKGSLSLLRGLIFAGILWTFWLFAGRVLTAPKNREVALFALVLLPVFIDFTFRRLSHTSLLCLAILLSYLMVHRLMRQKTWGNYALFGVVMGLGMLSKYNYAFFLGALGLGPILDHKLRAVVLHKRMALSILLATLILVPHLHWLLGPEGHLGQLRESIALKTGRETENTLSVLGPLFSLLWTLMQLLWPLFVVLAGAIALKKARLVAPKWDWFSRLALGQAVVLVLFFVVFNVHKVEERWLLPLLLPFVVWVFRSVRFKNETKWAANLYLVFCAAVLLQVLRTPVEKALNIPSSVHFGFEPLSDILNQQYADRPWVLPNVTYGGNIRLLNPEREVFAADDFSLPAAKRNPARGIVVQMGHAPSTHTGALRSLVNFGKEGDTLYFLPLNPGKK